MSRVARLTAGWSVALAVALLLSLFLAAPIAAPQPTLLAGATSPTPAETPGIPYPDDELPRAPQWTPPDRWAGSAGHRPWSPLGETDAAALRDAVDRARAKFGLDVLAVGMAAGARTWTGVSGLARDGVTPLDGDSPFGIASITKTFTASVVLQLVQEGRFSLDDEISSLLPDAGLPAGVTVRQLLNHTSGIADLLAPMRGPMGEDTSRIWTGPEVIARLGGPWFAPGADYGYSNSNYVILGMLVERATTRPFAEELSRRILRPIGLDETGVLTAEGAPPLMTPSWASAFGTSGYMYSSVSDLLDWSDALFSGRVLRPATMAQMLSFGEDGYGLGIERIDLGGHAGYGHSGLLRGFTSLLVTLPAEGVTLVIIGTWQGFDPGSALTFAAEGQRSILDVALAIAGP